MSPYEKKGMENNVPPWLVSPSVEVKFSNVPGLYLRKYGIYGLHIRMPPYQPGWKVPLHNILIYGLHIRLPPYHLGSEVPLHTMYTYLRLTYSSASLSTRIKSTAAYYIYIFVDCWRALSLGILLLNNTSTVLITLWMVKDFSYYWKLLIG